MYITTVYFKSGKVESISGDNAPSADELGQLLRGDSVTITFDSGSLSMPTESIDYIKVEKVAE